MRASVGLLCVALLVLAAGCDRLPDKTSKLMPPTAASGESRIVISDISPMIMNFEGRVASDVTIKYHIEHPDNLRDLHLDVVHPTSGVIATVPAEISESGQVVWAIGGQSIEVSPQVTFEVRNPEGTTSNAFVWGSPMQSHQDVLNLDLVSPMKIAAWPMDGERTRELRVFGSGFVDGSKLYVRVEGESDSEVDTKFINNQKLTATLYRSQLGSRTIGDLVYTFRLSATRKDGTPLVETAR